MNNNENEIDVENELKHWGILGMKWGIRNYQNEDGSLTPLGRIRYGVGPKKNITGNLMGANDASSLSNDELYKMTKRYKAQADYYNARNQYIYQENMFKQNTAPQKKSSAVGRFIGKVFGSPIENFLAKNVELGLSVLPYYALKNENPEFAAAYLSSISGIKMEYKKKDKVKDAAEKARIEADYWEQKNRLEKEKEKNLNPDYEKRINNFKDASNFNKYAKARSEMADFLKKKALDPSVSIDEYQKMVEDAEEVYGEYDPQYGFRY